MDTIDYIISLLESEAAKPDQLGIPGSFVPYQMLRDDQDQLYEYMKTTNFLREVLQDEMFSSKAKVEFINYGSTELVFVIKDGDKIYTLLVNQPNIELSVVENEYNNLIKLGKKHKFVVAPYKLYKNHERAAYLTPYIYQARCLGSEAGTFGAWIPEPFYRFENYNDDDIHTITSVMIAELVNLYDIDESLAVGKTKLGGGDFILEKEYDKEPHTIDNTLNRIHLIAARELIKVEFNEYLEYIRKEYNMKTYGNSDPSILFNYRNRAAITKEAIEDGIKLGKKLKDM